MSAVSSLSLDVVISQSPLSEHGNMDRGHLIFMDPIHEDAIIVQAIPLVMAAAAV